MLKTLRIKNYAIIQEVEIDFHTNLNIITGETGAGKSILMGALGLILGQRADARALMNADEKCVVEGSFALTADGLKDFFYRNELDYEDTCIIRREITASGKSRAFINDTPVTLNMLKELGEQLVDIVSQHETLELNEAAFQLSVLDAVAGNTEMLESYRQQFTLFKKTERQLAELLERESKARQDEDYFRFILNELTEAGIDENEQEKLEQDIETLSHAEAIKEVAYQAFASIADSEMNIVDQLRNIKSTLLPASKHHKSLAELSSRLEQNIVELKDIALELGTVAEQTNISPQELERLNERLQLLFNLQKKHRVADNAGLLQLQQALQHNIDALGSLQHEIEKTQSALTSQKEVLLKSADALSQKRSKTIPLIEKQVKTLLTEVAMGDASLHINNTTTGEEQLSNTGFDKVEFMFSANKGSALQPMNKVASGGELSRLMLCIKSLISDKVSLPTIIFDEIDTGISGEAASRVSVVLKKHASRHQVIAITHLPQIAAKADAHFSVFKQTDARRTVSGIRLLNTDERMTELAVMLSGNNPSQNVLSAARELMN